jgi:ERCC4-related helicase
MLNEEGNLIRAHKFVGRSGTKDEADKGLTQAEQKAVRETILIYY